MLIEKNSQNSSIPPSTEIIPPKRTKSLRKSTGRKSGGQLGHKGHNLKMVSTPDIIVKHKPDFCSGCGSNLSNTPSELVGKRQLIDIADIKFVTTEQQVYSRVCTCGQTNQGCFSQNANGPIGYGEKIESFVAYFHARHYLPVDRMREVFNDIFGLSLSTGGICHLLNRFAKKSAPVYELIKQKLTESNQVGSDETGCKINGDLQWFWTWQSPSLTYITHSANRGGDTISSHFPKGFPKSILVHDAWKPHLNTTAKKHQLCTAHLIRELNYLMELYKDDSWAKDFSRLLDQSLRLKYEMQEDDYKENKERDQIISTFKKMLLEPPEAEHKKAYTFYKRIVKNEEYIFTFLYESSVPPDNNASERAIRNIKVKQKISGQFKASQGAMNFAIIRSVIDTTLKNTQNVLDALKTIAIQCPNSHKFNISE